MTSAYYMYLAKMFFEKQGFIVIPIKVDYKSERNKEITILDFFPSADNLKNIVVGFREMVGRFDYTFKN